MPLIPCNCSSARNEIYSKGFLAPLLPLSGSCCLKGAFAGVMSPPLTGWGSVMATHRPRIRVPGSIRRLAFLFSPYTEHTVQVSSPYQVKHGYEREALCVTYPQACNFKPKCTCAHTHGSNLNTYRELMQHAFQGDMADRTKYMWSMFHWLGFADLVFLTQGRALEFGDCGWGALFLSTVPAKGNPTNIFLIGSSSKAVPKHGRPRSV